jgi:hypothetical protein
MVRPGLPTKLTFALTNNIISDTYACIALKPNFIRPVSTRRSRPGAVAAGMVPYSGGTLSKYLITKKITLNKSEEIFFHPKIIKKISSDL